MLLLTAVLLSACAERHTPALAQNAPDHGNNLASVRIAEALAYGAEHHDTRHRVAAVHVLDGLGARPAEQNGTDYARVWEAEAYRGQAVAPAYRGRILGPAYRTGIVAAGGTTVTDQLFIGGQSASLSVAPLRGARLALAVRNAGGAAVCQTRIKAPTSSCNWMAPYAERYHIEITNQGSDPAQFFLVVQ